MKHLFFGGIHPKYNKEMSTGITELKTLTPRQVVIPLRQHIGAPCTPLVKVGDCVKRGQKIGDGEGLCVPVHASVSGTVRAIEEQPHPTLGRCPAVVIDNDFQDTSVCAAIPESPDEILNAIREAGIVGMGGAAFPSNVKALLAVGKLSTVIANACECEPYITADDILLRTEPEHVLEGMLILKGILQPEHLVLAVEDNKTEAIGKIQSILAEYPGIELRILPTRYPQGSEKQLVQAVTGREIPSGKLPVDVECAVFNVSTFAAIYKAVRLGLPLTERIVTVTGEAVKTPQNLIVPIGTPFYDLISEAGGLSDTTERVLNGGPMMGIAQDDLSVPVVKATNAIVCLPGNPYGVSQNPACLRCGKCVEACPMRLQPLYLYRYCLCESVKELERLHLTDCMECGCCAYVCPAKLPLVEQFRKGKDVLRAAKAEEKAKEEKK